MLRVLVGRPKGAGLVLGWVQDHLGLRVLELGEVVALHALELHLQHARLGPLPEGAELDRPGDRVEIVAAQVLRKLVVGEALRALDGIGQTCMSE